MTLDKANELIAMHAQPGSGYNRNTVRVVFGEVVHDRGQAAVDQPSRGDGLAQSGHKPDMHLIRSFK